LSLLSSHGDFSARSARRFGYAGRRLPAPYPGQRRI